MIFEIEHSLCSENGDGWGDGCDNGYGDGWGDGCGNGYGDGCGTGAGISSEQGDELGNYTESI
jgi:hypothetical protein